MADTTAREPTAMSRSELEEEAAKGFERLRDTEFGRLLIAARASYLAEHGRFQTREAFERWWAEERGLDPDEE